MLRLVAEHAIDLARVRRCRDDRAQGPRARRVVRQGRARPGRDHPLDDAARPGDARARARLRRAGRRARARRVEPRARHDLEPLRKLVAIRDSTSRRRRPTRSVFSELWRTSPVLPIRSTPVCSRRSTLLERVPALLTCVPYAGELVREGSSSRRGTPFWAATMRVVEGPAAGAYAELRIWPQGRNRLWLLGRLATLTGLDTETIDTLDDDARLAALRRALADRSLRGSVEVAADGRLEVAFVDARARSRRAVARARRAARRTGVLPPLAADRRGRCSTTTRRSRSSPTASRSRPSASACAPPRSSRSTSRPTAARSARRPSGSPPTARSGSCRSPGPRATARPAPSSTATRCPPIRSSRCSPSPAARSWPTTSATSSSGCRSTTASPSFADPVDTSIAFRIFECVWALQDPAYVRQDARARDRRAPRRGRRQGRLRAQLLGRRPARARAAALRGARRARAARHRAGDRADRRSVRLRGPAARREPGGLPRGRATAARPARAGARRARRAARLGRDDGRARAPRRDRTAALARVPRSQRHARHVARTTGHAPPKSRVVSGWRRRGPRARRRAADRPQSAGTCRRTWACSAAAPAPRARAGSQVERLRTARRARRR